MGEDQEGVVEEEGEEARQNHLKMVVEGVEGGLRVQKKNELEEEDIFYLVEEEAQRHQV